MVNDQVNEIIHHEKFKAVETNWLSLNDLILHTNFKADIMIDILDVGKDELFEDFESNAVDITGSELFKKVYLAEYDQYGGRPYGSIVGLYDFEHKPQDEFWLRIMGKIAAASHAPFIGSMSPKFFGCDTIEELASIKDLEGLMNQPKYGSWNTLRDSEEAAYIGLTLPKYVVRLPYDPDTNPAGKMPFKEIVKGDRHSDFLWGSATIPFVKNMIRSFEQSRLVSISKRAQGWWSGLRAAGPNAGSSRRGRGNEDSH